MISRFPLHKRIYQHGQISVPPKATRKRAARTTAGAAMHTERVDRNRPSRHKKRETMRCVLFRRARGKGPGRAGRRDLQSRRCIHIFFTHVCRTCPSRQQRRSANYEVQEKERRRMSAAPRSNCHAIPHTRHKTSSIGTVPTSAPRPIGRHRRLPPEGRAPAPRRHQERPRRYHRKTPDAAMVAALAIGTEGGADASRSLQRSAPDVGRKYVILGNFRGAKFGQIDQTKPEP